MSVDDSSQHFQPHDEPAAMGPVQPPRQSPWLPLGARRQALAPLRPPPSRQLKPPAPELQRPASLLRSATSSRQRESAQTSLRSPQSMALKQQAGSALPSDPAPSTPQETSEREALWLEAPGLLALPPL